MALSLHVLCRVYGEVFGSPPFQNGSGAAAFTNIKEYPLAPLTQIPMNQATLWPLANGVSVGNGYYVYSVIELPASGLNVNSIKLATDQSVTALAAAAS